jgi:hypothetical protein
MGEGG